MELAPVLGADLKDLDEEAVELERRIADVGLDLELRVFARAAADGDRAGDLVVAFVNAVVDRGLEPGPIPAIITRLPTRSKRFG